MTCGATIYYYDCNTGSPVLFRNNEKDIYDMNGKPFAFIEGKDWFSYQTGSWIGWFENNWFFDKYGKPLYYIVE